MSIKIAFGLVTCAFDHEIEGVGEGLFSDCARWLISFSFPEPFQSLRSVQSAVGSHETSFEKSRVALGTRRADFCVFHFLKRSFTFSVRFINMSSA